MIADAKPERPSVTADWKSLEPRIDGMVLHEVKHVATRNGVTTELFRAEWDLLGGCRHVIHVKFHPGGFSAWNLHERQTDGIYVVRGQMRLVLFDDWEDSPTYRKLDVLHLSAMRLTLVVVLPGVWHGIENSLAHEDSAFVNVITAEYRYDNPDSWHAPPDTPDIPYRFPTP